MPLADYAHWNEEAAQVWWQEEGRHEPMQSEEYGREDAYSAADAFAEEMYDTETADLKAMLNDKEYLARWPKAKQVIEDVLDDRGEG